MINVERSKYNFSDIRHNENLILYEKILNDLKKIIKYFTQETDY